MDSSLLLELAASDDLTAFRHAVEVDRHPHHLSSSWYSRTASNRMQLNHYTPVHIAAMYNSTAVLNYLISNSPSIINSASVSDSATPLHCAAGSGAVDAAKILIANGASTEAVDAAGRRPADLIPRMFARSMSLSPKQEVNINSDLGLPDVNSGVYGTDEFRMYSFKVKPCSRAYSHDWTECPFAHPGENARRRDPLKFVYSCVPCPEFKKSGACRNGDGCEYAHGVFESWLHPAQYRTRLCKDEVGCGRRVCFFAHKVDELRSVNPAAASVGMAMPSSPRLSYTEMAAAIMMMQPGSPSRKNVNLELEMRGLGLGVEGYHSPRANMRMNTITKAAAATAAAQYQSMSQQLMSGYGTGMNNSSSMGLDHSAAKAIMNSRASTFAKRSQSFIDRRGAANVAPGWSSPTGKVDWGAKEDELSKLRRSASFGLWGGTQAQAVAEEPDVSWVHSLVREEQMVA